MFCEFGGEVEPDEMLRHQPNVYGNWRGTSERSTALDVHEVLDPEL